MCLNKLKKLKFSLGEEDNTLLHKSSLVDMKKAVCYNEAFRECTKATVKFFFCRKSKEQNLM